MIGDDQVLLQIAVTRSADYSPRRCGETTSMMSTTDDGLDLSEPDAWMDYMVSSAVRWKQDVGMPFYTESVCDAKVSEGDGGLLRLFQCNDCEVAFASQKALDQHMRIKHGVRCPQRAYAPADATCAVCGTKFAQRLRLLAHLCDKRRCT